MNPDIMKQAGFGEELKAVNMGKCPGCHEDVGPNDFRDTLSRKEYFISGLCQQCQDKVFGGGE
jgi:hypothetical protein